MRFSAIDIPMVRSKIVELHSQGKTNSEIADEIEVKRSIVQRWVRNDLGLEPNVEPMVQVFNQERAERMAENMQRTRMLLMAGESSTQIAVRLGLSRRRISEYKRMMGLSKPVTPFTAEERERALELLEDGASYAEVARTVGHSEHYIGQVFPGYGWTPKMTGEYMAARERYGDL